MESLVQMFELVQIIMSEWKGISTTEKHSVWIVYVVRLWWVPCDRAEWIECLQRDLLSKSNFWPQLASQYHFHPDHKLIDWFLPVFSHQRNGFHRVRGHDVRVHHRPSGLAAHRDDLLLQENISSRRGSVTRSCVSTLTTYICMLTCSWHMKTLYLQLWWFSFDLFSKCYRAFDYFFIDVKILSMTKMNG